jgi:hypothetical protein
MKTFGHLLHTHNTLIYKTRKLTTSKHTQKEKKKRKYLFIKIYMRRLFLKKDDEDRSFFFFLFEWKKKMRNGRMGLEIHLPYRIDIVCVVILEII